MEKIVNVQTKNFFVAMVAIKFVSTGPSYVTAYKIVLLVKMNKIALKTDNINLTGLLKWLHHLLRLLQDQALLVVCLPLFHRSPSNILLQLSNFYLRSSQFFYVIQLNASLTIIWRFVTFVRVPNVKEFWKTVPL